MVAGFVVLAAAQAVVPVPTPRLRRLTRIAAATTLAAGVIQVSDPRCPQPDDPDATIGDLGHGAASVATFVLWTSMPFVAMRESGEQRHGRLARALAVPTVVAMVVAGVTTRRDSSFKGAAQRVFLALVSSFLAATGVARETPGHS